jgi:hypothetical protein
MNYHTLMQADADRWKYGKGKQTIVVAGASMSTDSDENSAANIHPVATVMGSSHLAAYMPSNMSNVIEGESDLDVSTYSVRSE